MEVGIAGGPGNAASRPSSAFQLRLMLPMASPVIPGHHAAMNPE
jgi:hypothetical protein